MSGELRTFLPASGLSIHVPGGETMNAERQRLQESKHRVHRWKKWGPYLSERQWGTVREDYSAYGTAWEYSTHDMARSLAYRWGEDGLAGLCDEGQNLCFAVALWNGKDPILKERLFGLTGNEGNHGEDVKEIYYYLDSTPTHSYMKALYKYPQVSFPYELLIEENRRRNKGQPEFELIDTGVFDQDRYFDVFIEYAKRAPDDILVRLSAINRGPEPSSLHILPQFWFRNTWSWGHSAYRPVIEWVREGELRAIHREVGVMRLYHERGVESLFCDNETNTVRLYGIPGSSGYFKDGFHEYLIRGNRSAINPEKRGTKAGLHNEVDVGPGMIATIRLRLSPVDIEDPLAGFDDILESRRREADEFYAELQTPLKNEDLRLIQRQALAGMLWSKQFYYIDVPQWLNGDPGQPTPPDTRKNGRNHEWVHVNNADILSMPDKWEYPWYAAWDLAFHCIPLAMVDVEFAKEQLRLLTHEWYMHPNGQLPAYEWNFGDVNPPVHAWATWRVYSAEKRLTQGKGDVKFLEMVFHKLLLNFTWWVNRKDLENRNIFQGGFLGLDNIGVFDRSAELPTGGHIEQADATSWMAMYSLNLMRIALELSRFNDAYEGMATKFFEHFLLIAGAMANVGGEGIDLWDEEDQFFYDVLHLPNNGSVRLKVRSLVGLTPLFAVEIIDDQTLQEVPNFAARLEWFLQYRPDLARLVSYWHTPGIGSKRLLSLLRGHRMKRLLKRMLDESEFLSDYGVRALSRFHEKHPYVLHANGHSFSVAYQAGESESGLFGGNSNWRGPVWFPMNYMLIASLYKFHAYYGDDFKIEHPTGSGRLMTIKDVADDLSVRMVRLFMRQPDGRRPVFGSNEKYQRDPHFQDYLLFYEYFHGDSGRGVGASHQTGWTGLVAKLAEAIESNQPT